MIEPEKLADTLEQLSTALETGTLVEIGELWQIAQIQSVGMLPASASKARLMQVLRVHLMQQFGAEIMRVGSSIGPLELEVYDIQVELADVIDELKEYHR